jgi:hypothetical protein
MTTCPKCGKEIEEQNYFCKFCGAAIRPATDPVEYESELKNTVDRRLNAIKTHDEETISSIVEKGLYTKFDDWPPLNLQDSTEALENERGAYKVIQKYDYEINYYKEERFDDFGLATLQIHYWGTIRNQDFDVNSRVTIVLKKLEEKWKIVHEHWSRFPEKRQRKGLF